MKSLIPLWAQDSPASESKSKSKPKTSEKWIEQQQKITNEIELLVHCACFVGLLYLYWRIDENDYFQNKNKWYIKNDKLLEIFLEQMNNSQTLLETGFK